MGKEKEMQITLAITFWLTITLLTVATFM